MKARKTRNLWSGYVDEATPRRSIFAFFAEADTHSEVHRVRADRAERRKRRYSTHEWTGQRLETKLKDFSELKLLQKHLIQIKIFTKQKASLLRDSIYLMAFC